ANTELPKLSRDEQRGRGALLQDICKGTKLKKVTSTNDRSAPVLEKPKGSSGGYGSGAAALQPKGGLFQGGVPKLRPVGAKDGSVLSGVFVENLAGKPALQVPGSRAAAPRPPGCTASGRPQDDTDSSRASLPDLPRTQRPSLPDLSRPNTASSAGMKHSSSAPPPPPPGRRANAPPTPLPVHSSKAAAYNREKPLPPTPGQRLHLGREGPPAPPPVKPPPSPVNVRTGPSGQSLAPPPPPYRQPPGVPNGPSSPTNETPAGPPPPPPPPLRNGHRDSITTVRSFLDDFESKYSFHPVEDFPAPEEYKHFQRIYPSKTNRAARGAPPLPPILRKRMVPSILPETCMTAPNPTSRLQASSQPPPSMHLVSGLGDRTLYIDSRVSNPASIPPLASPAGQMRKKIPCLLLSSGESCVAIMPQTRSQSQATISFPKKKQPRTLDKAKNSSDTKLELTNVQAIPRSPCAKILPLSPRKRLGDDNLCNTPRLPPCSPPKQSKKENGPPRSRTSKGRRLVFDNQLTTESPSKREQARVHQNKIRSSGPKGQDIATNSEQRRPLEKESACLRLLKQEGTCYQQAKQLLTTAVPDQLPAREKEMDVIRNFLREHICGKKAGSLYLSGAPGTGKTACLSRILQDLKKELKGFKTIMLNCMSLRSAQAVFPAIAQEICQEEVSRPAGKDIMRKLENHMTAEKGPMIVLVLDEMDQLDSRGQDVLYTLFEWPWLSTSRLVLIGKSPSESLVPKRVGVIHISQVISEVDGNRMTLSREGAQDSFPLQQKILVCSLLLLTRQLKIKEVTLGKIHSLLKDYRVTRDMTFKQHLFSLVSSQLYEAYSNVCRKQQVAAVDQSECLSLSGLLEARGIFGLKKNKEMRFAKVSLKIEEKEIEHALKDKALVGNILATGLP
ncbi:hypothetical protein E2I00_013889, partial [Balaenoptera physalus]